MSFKKFQDFSERQLIGLFIGNTGGFSRLSIIIELGNRLLNAGGKNITIEYFLRSVLTGGDQPKSLLSLALGEEKDPAERQRLAREIKEKCFAFLEACRENLESSTVRLLDWLKDYPPYSEFIRLAKEKMTSNKMEQVVADSHCHYRPEVVEELAKNWPIPV